MSAASSKALLALGLGIVLSACGGGSGIGGPKYSLSELRELYGSSSPLIELVGEKGNVEHIKIILHYDLTEQEIAKLYLDSAENGHLDAVKFILNKYPDSLGYGYNKDKDDNYDYGSAIAVINGHYEIAYYIIDTFNFKDSVLLTYLSNMIPGCESNPGFTEGFNQGLLEGSYRKANIKCSDILKYGPKIKDKLIEIGTERSQ